MTRPSIPEQSREPNVGDPNEYIAHFEDWMSKHELNWFTVSLSNITQYRTELTTQGLIALEIIPRITVIANVLSQATREQVRPHRYSFYGHGIDAVLDELDDFVTPGPGYEEIYRSAVESRDYQGRILRLAIEQKKELESGTYGTLIGQVSSPEKASILFDLLIQILDVDGRIRLTREEGLDLLRKPGIDTLKGLRDTTVIALLLCTGIREAEAQALTVADLHYRLSGMHALHVPAGQGCTERLVPYGQMIWVLDIVNAWLTRAGIRKGPILRGLYRNSVRIRPGRLGLRSIRQILDEYPIKPNLFSLETSRPAPFTVTPLDLRRTYATHLYRAGLDLGAIAANLGVADVKTVLEYVGKTQALEQFPPSLYEYDTAKLKAISNQE